MSNEKIQVREGWWRQRCGDIVRVWCDNDEDAEYPWASACNSYTQDGAVFFGYVDEQDLVEYIGKNITITAAEYVDARPAISHATCDGCNTQLTSNAQWLCPECAKTLDALSEYVKQRSAVSRER